MAEMHADEVPLASREISRHGLAIRPRARWPGQPSEAATRRERRRGPLACSFCLYPPSHPGGITLDLVVYVLRAWASAVGVCRRLRTAETPMRLMRCYMIVLTLLQRRRTHGEA